MSIKRITFLYDGIPSADAVIDTSKQKLISVKSRYPENELSYNAMDGRYNFLGYTYEDVMGFLQDRQVCFSRVNRKELLQGLNPRDLFQELAITKGAWFDDGWSVDIDG